MHYSTIVSLVSCLDGGHSYSPADFPPVPTTQGLLALGSTARPVKNDSPNLNGLRGKMNGLACKGKPMASMLSSPTLAR